MAARGNSELARAEVGQSAREAKLARLKAKKPVRGEYRVYMSDEPMQAVNNARAELAMAQDGLAAASSDTQELAEKRVTKAQATLEAAIKAAEDDSELLVFEGIPRDLFEKILDDHPPTDEQKAKGADYDKRGVAPILISACCVDPGFDSADEVREVMARWNASECEAVYLTAFATCTMTRGVDWGKGFAANLF